MTTRDYVGQEANGTGTLIMDDHRQEIDHVHDFHVKFNVPVPTKPTPLSPDMFKFRHGFLEEEVHEFSEAYEAGDMAKQFDALIDLVYVALGTIIIMGLRPVWRIGWCRVQHANMKKVAGVKTDRHAQFDITKPAGWLPPDHSDLVKSDNLGNYDLLRDSGL